MTPIKKVPDMPWTDRAASQIASGGGDALVGASEFAYRLGNAGIIGFIYHSLIAPPWLWMALAETATMRDFIDFRRAQDMIPKGTLTAVEQDDKQALRFAEFYGFEPTGGFTIHADRAHLIMRKK